MARMKKSESAPPIPKDWRDVKRGCVSCRFFLEDPKKHPCLPCIRWSHWEDAEPDQPKPFPAVSSTEFKGLTDTPEQIEAVLKQNTSVSKPEAHKTRKTVVVPEESDLSSIAPKKKPGRPKKAIVVPEEPVSKPETPATELTKNAGRSKNLDREPHEQTTSAGTDQLRFNL